MGWDGMGGMVAERMRSCEENAAGQRPRWEANETKELRRWRTSGGDDFIKAKGKRGGAIEAE